MTGKLTERFTVYKVTKITFRRCLTLLIGTLLFSSVAWAQEFSEKALAKAPPGLLKRLSDNAPSELIIQMDDTEVVQAAAKSRSARDLVFDDADILDMKVEKYAKGKSDLLGVMKKGDVDVISDFKNLPLMFGRIRNRAALSLLLNNPKVVRVFENVPHFLSLAESLNVIHQQGAEVAGYSGQGTTVAVLDTGADFARAAFGNCTAPNTPAGCKVVFAQDFTSSDDGALDAHGHGTNVSGIVVGVAPDTRIAALDVFTGDRAYVSDIIAGIDWVIGNQAAFNIVAMNLSLGASNYSAECTTSWAAVPFANARAVGVTPVVASGNDASKSTIASPACTPGAIRVGATYDSSMGSKGWFPCTDNETHADLVTCFSNSASFLTLLAPGSVITSAGLSMSGTSMASPHVAGAVAVLRSTLAFPGDTINQTIARLTSTGQPVVDPGNGLTHPRIDLAAALSVPIPGQLPKITTFQPTRASQGQTVTIHGSGFLGAATVKFGGTAAQSFTVDSPLKITAPVGTGATGSVTVTNSEGSASLVGFEFRSASLDSISTLPTSLEFGAFGQYAQLTVNATFGDASEEEITSTSSFGTSNPAVAGVSALGKITALGNGSAVVTAYNSGFEATTSVSVFFETITTKEIEPNNNVLQANPVSLQGGAFSGQLSSTNDIDLFVLTSEQAGELRIMLRPENNSYDGGSVRARILDTSGVTLAGRIIRSDDSQFSTLRVLLPAPGTVYLRLDQRPGYTIFDKDYEVETTWSNDPQVFTTRELESNLDFDTATKFPANGASFSGQLFDTTDIDMYRFDVIQRGALSLLINPENNLYDGGSIRAAIVNAGGETLAAKIIRSDQSQMTNLSALIDRPGSVYLRVDRRAGYTIFDKDYNVNSNFNDDPLVFASRETESNNNYARTNHFPTDGAVISGQLYDETDVDVFGFGLGPGVVAFGIAPENKQYDGGSILVSLKDGQDNVLSSRTVRSDEPSVIEVEAGIGQRGLYYLVIEKRPGYSIFDKDYQITTPAGNFSNHSPNITSQPKLSASIGVPYSYGLSATDSDGDKLFFYILSGPIGMEISEGSVTLTWTPESQQWGENYVDIVVFDNFGGIDTQNFIITVPRPEVIFKDGFEATSLK